MLEAIRPDMVCRDVWSIDIDALGRMGVRALVFDLDNTLTLWNQYDVSKNTMQWIDDCRARGIKMCICSNNHAPRIQPVAGALGLDFIAEAGKPKPHAYLSACERLGARPVETAAVGDQLMTDVIGAKRAGLRAVLVNPIGRREFLGTYFNRMAERPLLWLMGIKRP